MNSIEYVEEILVERREVIDGGIGETIALVKALKQATV